MKTLYVYADFDCLKEITLVGELSYDSLRGADNYRFSFDKAWLKKHGNLFLSPDLNNYLGAQYTQPGKDIFGCFSDALPDRWGRTLLNRREQISAREEMRPVRKLSSFDYLVGIDDFSRMGGFRFKENPDEDFINSSNELRVPPLSSIRELLAASREIESCEEHNLLPGKKWLDQLIRPGTSLGGARPKANVVADNGSLHIAKFPSKNDDYDVELWEHFCHKLASSAGIRVAETTPIPVNDKFHILLSRRFDRTATGKRVHFASAMTLLGLSDGADAAAGHGYLDIVDFILQNGACVEENLRELYRRVAFNILVGNSDDHFRNHGFLLTHAGWMLSPAYDMNPTLRSHLGLLINSDTNEADLEILLESHEDYMLPRSVAEEIIKKVVVAGKNWNDLATRLGICKRERDMFSGVFEKSMRF